MNEENDDATDWRSLTIASVIALFTAIQFTIYFSSLWPYLLQLDPNATESFFGWITAVYSLAQAVMCVGFGYLQNRMKQSKIPILIGLSMMFLGNFTYLLCAVTPYPPKWIMFTSRFITGLGAGMITVLRTYAINASTVSDRSRSISLNSGSFALGITIGPAIQIIFSPLGYPGINLFGALDLDMYTAPAFMGIVANSICACLVIFFFRESNVGLRKAIIPKNDEHVRFFALPSYDRIAIMICIFTRFAQMFVITNLETLGAPLSMTMFGWNKQQTVQYNSLMHGGFGFIGFVIYAVSVYYDIGKMLNHRVCTCVGMLALLTFHLLTFPWCETTPPVSPVLFIVTYIFINGPAFSLINVCMNTVFSTVIGPRNQPKHIAFPGHNAGNPITERNLFTEYGPRPAWGIEIVLAGIGALLWIIFYKRIVPLKLPHTLSAGDTFKNKYGHVYKF
ncbi:transporter, major facilitator family protein [Necator americanus]|uniref:Transporter, major facilitator family protein n=1 Tax=Necator americanus TaxID=51031 RepID=W2TNJ2_NECAM|nr:transporter, major facilitator family protein [Necator americanus]ETN83670.1 transporter, major facilitator family protein [Necator americanus]